jgi:hypothetical protein
MTTLGDLIRGAASGVATRLGIGAAGQVLGIGSGIPAWGNYAPWLARTTYAPASVVTYTIGSSLAVVDATNLSVGFIVPSSGNVVLVASIMCQLEPGSSTSNYVTAYLAFVAHGTTTLVSGYQVVLTNQNAGATLFHSQVTASYLVPVTGLTPGAALQYDLASIYANTGTPSQVSLYAGGGATVANAGPATLLVYPA